ncbi:kinase-like domain-containing protein [Rhizophagus clarus]|uniref:Kinase-like domain-containing protein n=1 Tax=Rhizophagus clarus TaxID=94130 RepID=A0A8H3KTF0_9GLOM|nr:kinase-like domain-containing protein [Rhizophagus clarus]
MHQTPNVLNQYESIPTPKTLHQYMYYINTNANMHQTPNVLNRYQRQSILTPDVLHQYLQTYYMYYINTNANMHQTPICPMCHLQISQLEEYYASGLKKLEIHCYDHQDFEILPVTIGSGGFSSVSAARWNNTSTIFAIKKFVDNKEVYLTRIADGHQNIIRLYGVTKLDGKGKYSLVLEYAEGGTLRNYLRDITITFKWEDQLRFAKEIASAILWLHEKKEIIHGDLHPNNILIHKGTIKIADFGRSFEKGENCTATKIWGVIPYVDSKMLEMLIQKAPHVLTEKSDIYSLGVIIWELTSRKSPFNFEECNNQRCNYSLINIISKGTREKPVKETNDKFVLLYEKCWQHEPNDRPDIKEVISELNLINPENENVSIITLKKSKNVSTEDLCLPD